MTLFSSLARLATLLVPTRAQCSTGMRASIWRVSINFSAQRLYLVEQIFIRYLRRALHAGSISLLVSAVDLANSVYAMNRIAK